MRRFVILLSFLALTAGRLLCATRAPFFFCPQVANYTIDARLDPETRGVTARELLEWTNPTSDETGELWFHLYWNAFLNNQSTFMIESDREAPTSVGLGPQDWGWCRVENIRILPFGGFPPENLLPTMTFRHPDDDNIEDRTVFTVRLPRPIRPGETIRLEITFSSRVPTPISRTGVIRDAWFFAQWFPKLGVFQSDGWNCHQYHAFSEYYADYGTYDVRLTLPARYRVGATGEQRDRQTHADGTVTHRFVQHSVHDFAWTADPHAVQVEEDYEYLPGRKVKITLLLQPRHRHLRERYLLAVRNAVTYSSRWLGDYPYTTITCVDPAYNSRSGGMEYPTFFTGGAYFISPARIPRPESVTIHEFGHGYFYGLIGSNEFEFPWMDEGMNSYLDTAVYYAAYGEPVFSENYFGIPVAFPDFSIPIESQGISAHRRTWNMDILQRMSWDFMNGESYGANAYAKGQLLMLTLRRVLGEETFARMLKAYSTRWWWKHPRPDDFFDVAAEFGGPDITRLLDQILYSSSRLDYAVQEIRNLPERTARGWFDENYRKGEGPVPLRYESEVLIRRLGEVMVPVDILVIFENGRVVREQWDGRYRWTKLRYRSPFRIAQAVVDPDFIYVLDLDRTNNGRTAFPQRLAPAKWTSRWLLWIQHALEWLTILGG